MKCTLCVLAAGESKRFKGEKLLHVYKKKTISEHVLDLINKLNPNDSICFHKFIITKPKLSAYFKSRMSCHWHLIENHSYREGMSTSIRLAVREAEKINSDSLLLFLADMPKVKTVVVQEVLQMMQNHPNKIIRPIYKSIPGFPVALPKSLFAELTKLQGDVGAKQVIEKHKDLLILIESTDAGCVFDIDEDI